MSDQLRDSTDRNNENSTIIVIGRQFGSGGRHIGKLVAQLTGFTYYDSEILSKTAEKLGFSRHIFDIHDEKRPYPMRSMLQGVFGLADNFHDVSICNERMYVEQSKVIREICKRGSCVIVGRTADYIMRNHPGMVSVFLHSPIEKRALRVIRRGEADNLQQAIEKAKRYDRNRENYYNFYTGNQGWGKAWNYSLTIDSSLADEKTVAEIIITFAKNKRQEQK